MNKRTSSTGTLRACLIIRFRYCASNIGSFESASAGSSRDSRGFHVFQSSMCRLWLERKSHTGMILDADAIAKLDAQRVFNSHCSCNLFIDRFPFFSPQAQVTIRLTIAKRRTSREKMKRCPNTYLLNWVARCCNFIHAKPKSRTRQCAHRLDRLFHESDQLLPRSLLTCRSHVCAGQWLNRNSLHVKSAQIASRNLSSSPPIKAASFSRSSLVGGRLSVWRNSRSMRPSQG
jgi:hypothetical protein